MTNNDELLGKIFEMVNTKAEAKPKKKRKPMTPEQRERCLANLKTGRETSLRKRKEKAAAAKAKKEKPKKARTCSSSCNAGTGTDTCTSQTRRETEIH